MISKIRGFKYDWKISVDTRQPLRILANSDSSFTAMMYAIEESMSTVSKLYATISICHDSKNLPVNPFVLNMPIFFPFRANFAKSNNLVKFLQSLLDYIRMKNDICLSE